MLVSEAIGLEIVASNGGSYTGAILFTGFMYIGAAASLWMVRAWKIGELEKQAAIDGKADGDASRTAPDGFKRSTFAKRLIAWRKV
jgi:hypothetical protein